MLEHCPICPASAMTARGPYAHCPSCDYWASSLVPDITSEAGPDSEYELVSYEHTRRANYTRILDMLKRRHRPGARMLEVGCADGLFLEMAEREAGFFALGIEPNTRMMNGNRFGREILRGLFPEALAGRSGDDRFDIIALNCVFEHVPDIRAMIADFDRHLAPGGSVMINVPMSSGIMFRVARALYRGGVRYPFDRLWQKGFVSPHLHYFDRDNLARLFAGAGFDLADSTPLQLFSLGGLDARLDLDPNIRLAQRVTALGALYAYYPFSRLVPDAYAFVFAPKAT
jgi:SAM-dependent methyltransferase